MAFSIYDTVEFCARMGMEYFKEDIFRTFNVTRRQFLEDNASSRRLHNEPDHEHNFEFEIYFYEVPSNKNGKMSQQVYIDQILEPIVKPWIQTHQDFVLEEDGNSGHGPGKLNIVRIWKSQFFLTFAPIYRELLAAC